uniref:Putative secreted protein n=1 Tax=Ixodes ricinus TaxID=34613 RepID=A0A6B0UFM8_IXORI
MRISVVRSQVWVFFFFSFYGANSICHSKSFKEAQIEDMAMLPTNVRPEISLCHNLQLVWIRVTFHNFYGLCLYARAHSRFDSSTNFLKMAWGALDELGVCFV